jgi:dienelactone hydrolase
MASDRYDPFAAGPCPVGVRTFEVRDDGRGRVFPAEIWYPAAGGAADGAPGEQRDAPAADGSHPVVVFSHHSGGDRRTASYLSTHLASHGYAVAAMNHSELVAAELGPQPDESPSDRLRRIDAIIASRVPDVRVLLSALLDGSPVGQQGGVAGIGLDPDRVALAGHSFGGWTALAAPEQEPRVRSVVALAPGGGSQPRPGVLPLTLAFGWERAAPVLILAAELDVPIALDGVQDIFRRAPEPKQMFVLRRADHAHFADDVEASHERLRAMTLPGEAAWMTAAMLPASELCPGEDAHRFARGLTLAHLDVSLLASAVAGEFLAAGTSPALAASGLDAYEYAGTA